MDASNWECVVFLDRTCNGCVQVDSCRCVVSEFLASVRLHLNRRKSFLTLSSLHEACCLSLKFLFLQFFRCPLYAIWFLVTRSISFFHQDGLPNMPCRTPSNRELHHIPMRLNCIISYHYPAKYPTKVPLLRCNHPLLIPGAMGEQTVVICEVRTSSKMIPYHSK